MTGARGGRRRRPRAARAFVLPVVILLMLVVGLAATVMLMRADAQAREVDRQITATRVHHASRGIRQALDAWLSRIGADSLGQALDDDGFALSLEPGDGTEVRIYAFPAQGLVLDAQDAGRGTRLEEINRRSVEILELRYGEVAARRFTRSAGPPSIAVIDAPSQVLRAVAEAVAPPEIAGSLGEALVELARDPDASLSAGVLEAATDVGLDNDGRAALAAILTARPTLYEIVIDVRGSVDPAATGPSARYRSLAEFATRRANPGPHALYESPPPFLTWQREPTDPYTTGPPRPPSYPE